MSMNLRQLARIDEPYFQLDREERHLAGILFHLLNYKDNVALALQSVEAGWNINPAEFGVYLEYSYPRDLWNKMEVKDGGRNGAESNKHKRDVIIEMLGSQGFDTSKLASRKQVKDFNSFFIEAPRPSSLYIQSPANWSLAQIADSLPSPASNSDLVIACKIKWAFKAKPDIVIHADREHALCIELKLEAGESSYPSDAEEKKLLRKRVLFGEKEKHLPFPMKQTDLQKFLMTELLGLDCRFRFITRHETSGTECVSWTDFLRLLEPLPDPPPYIRAALKNAVESSLKVGL